MQDFATSSLKVLETRVVVKSVPIVEWFDFVMLVFLQSFSGFKEFAFKKAPIQNEGQDASGSASCATAPILISRCIFPFVSR